MGFVELLFIAVGLSMDAFAVSLCKGLSLRKVTWKQGALVGLFFGGFQAVMPLIGWLLGTRFARYITAVDHWIAFVLLLFIGGRMIVGALKKDEEAPKCDVRLDIKDLALMAVATSIDALAVGITFAFLKVNILPAVTLIGVTTFLLSFVGVFIGKKFGARYKKKAELVGGVVLVLMGMKILIEHLMA